MSTFQMIPLSSLSAGRQNPRKVQPRPDAHQRLCASIRSRGLLQPLVVVANAGGDSGEVAFTVKAGKRRLNALRTIHRNQPDTPVACNVQDVDEQEAAAMALAENVHRENMHPLDEAEAFARIAHIEAKGVGAVAAEFGVQPRYVRQRIQLAGLADAIKAAYREGDIDTETAEVFASVPASTQMEVWDENGGRFRSAQHVRSLIASDWIEARHARFDPTALPDSKVSRDLFSERVLVERQAFFEAQADALMAERDALLEEGWADVMIVAQQDVPDAIYQMDAAPTDFDDTTLATLEALHAERSKLDQQIDDRGDVDDAATDALWDQLDALDTRIQQTEDNADTFYNEEVKAVGTVLLTVGADGGVTFNARVPRASRSHQMPGVTSGGASGGGGEAKAVPEVGPETLSEKQIQAALAQEVVAVRKALSGDDARARRTRRVVLALMLHRSIYGDAALTIRREPDRVDELLTPAPPPESDPEGDTDTPPNPSMLFTPWAWLKAKAQAADPLHQRGHVDPMEAYHAINQLGDRQLDELIDTLTVSALSGSIQNRSPLIAVLAQDLDVNIRAEWRPDAVWFAGYRKLSLAKLIGEFFGPKAGQQAGKRKKSELVEEVTRLFKHAAVGKLDNPDLAARMNAWTPVCLHDKAEAPTECVA